MSAPLPLEDLELVLSPAPTFSSRVGGYRLFITGGTGFIGSWLLQLLQRASDQLNRQIDLLVPTHDSNRTRQHFPHPFERAGTRLEAGDVSTIAEPVGAFDLCTRAPAEVGNPHQAVQPLKANDTIMLGNQHTPALAQSAGARCFLYGSTVYCPQPIDLERMPESYAGAPRPLYAANAYGNAKRAAKCLAWPVPVLRSPPYLRRRPPRQSGTPRPGSHQ